MFKSSIKDVAKFMQTARERYAYALAADSEDRQAAESDVDFVHGEQWTDTAFKKRKKQKRPILTWNRLPTFCAQIVNDGRENKPSIRFTPMDGGNPATANFLQARARHIEYECDADIAYDSSREQQVISGRGFYRLGTEYKPCSFDQRPTIEPIENQFSVLFDPGARKYNRSDANYCFVFSWLAKESYEQKYGESEAARSNYFANDSNPAPDWIGAGEHAQQIQVAEYWVKSWKKRPLCLLDDLTCVYKDELATAQADRVMDTREDDVCVVTQYIINGVEILDETEFPVPFIPIVPVWGRQMMVKGRRRNYSLVRFAKDPQRLVNLYVSNIAEQVALMPKTSYIAAVGQIEGLEDQWDKINEDPNSVTLYNPQSVNGDLVERPSRETAEPPIQALSIGLAQAIDGIKAAMGIFDASLGSGPGDTAGVAIEKRQKESDVANFHFADNEARSRKYAGRIMLALIKVLDKGRRQVPTRAEDGKTHLVWVHHPTTDPKTGEPVIHNLSRGEYEPAVSTGPSYTSQREAANAAYGEIARHDKNFMGIAGDLFFRTSDFPGADLIADRYEKMLPAQLQPQGPNTPQATQQLQQAVTALSAQHEQAVTLIHNLSQIIEQKQIESASKERIAALQESTKLRVEAMRVGNAQALAEADREANRLELMFDRAHEAGLSHQQHQNAKDLVAAQPQPEETELPEAA